MKKLWLISFLSSLCIFSNVSAQTLPIVVNTAMSEAIYTPGVHEGDPIVIPPGANMFRVTLDRTLCLDTAVSVTFNLERLIQNPVACFPDSECWQFWAGAGTRCGLLKDRFGNLISASSFSTALPPSDPLVRVVYDVAGGNASTNSAISTWEVLP